MITVPVASLRTAVAALLLLLAGLPGARAAVPGNDSFSNALLLQGGTFLEAYSNEEASVEPGEPAATGASTVWFKWAAWNDSVTISTLGSNFSTMLGLYAGTSLGTLTAVTPAPEATNFSGLPAPFNGAHQLTFPTVPSQMYYIAVGGTPTGPSQHLEQGKIMLSLIARNVFQYASAGVAVIAPGTVYAPAGSLADVQVPVFRLFSTAGAVQLTANLRSGTATEADFVRTSSTTLNFADGQAVTYLTLRSLSQSSPGPDKTLFVNLVTQSLSLGLRSSFTLSEPAITLLNNRSPANDNLAGATTLHGTAGAVNISNWGATAEPGETAGKHGLVRSVWFTWTAPRDGVVTFRNHAGSIGPLNLFTGTSLAALSPVSATPAAMGTSATQNTAFAGGSWSVTGGTTYQLLVDDLLGSATTGNGLLAWSLTGAPASPVSLAFAPGVVTALEGDGLARITVNRSGDVTGFTTVAYALRDGDAVAGLDYDATPGVFFFAPGETSKDIIVPVYPRPDRPITPKYHSFYAVLTPAPETPEGAIDPAAFVAQVQVTSNDHLFNAVPLQASSTNRGSVHGSTAGSTVGDSGELPHGSPASTTSVWYTLKPGGSGVVSFTCPQAMVEVFSDVPGTGFASVGAPFFDSTASAWRCTVYVLPGRTFYICLSNPGGHGGPFDLEWEPGTTLSWSQRSNALEGTSVTLDILRGSSGTGGASAMLSSATVRIRAVGQASNTAPAATAGVDFDGSYRQVTFAPGEKVKTLSINLFDDGVAEVAEEFILELTCIAGNATAVTPYASFLVTPVRLYNNEPYVPSAGNYQALMKDGSRVINATASVVRLANHRLATHLTGVVVEGLKTYRFSITLDSAGTGSVHIPSPNGGFQLYIRSTEGGGSLLFSETATGESFVTADRQIYNARTNPAPAAGLYTATIDRNKPVLAKVSTAGVLTMTGMLGDGSVFTSSVSLRIAPNASNAKPHATLSVPLYGGRGWLRGDIQFDDTRGDALAFTSSLHWLRPAIRGAAYYPDGFDLEGALLAGQRYAAPARGVRAMPGLDGAGTFQLILGQDGFESVGTTATCWWLLNNQINTSSFSQIPTPFGSIRVSLAVQPANGLLTGSIVYRGVTYPLRAVVLQGTGDLEGYFLVASSKISQSVKRLR